MKRGLIFLAALAAACGTVATGTSDFKTQNVPRWDIRGGEPLEYLGGDWYREAYPLLGGPGYLGLSPWGWGGVSPWGWGGVSPWGLGGVSPWGWGGASPWGWGGVSPWGLGGASPWMGPGPGMWPPQAGRPPMPQPSTQPTTAPLPMGGGYMPLRDTAAGSAYSNRWSY